MFRFAPFLCHDHFLLSIFLEFIVTPAPLAPPYPTPAFFVVRAKATKHVQPVERPHSANRLYHHQVMFSYNASSLVSLKHREPTNNQATRTHTYHTTTLTNAGDISWSLSGLLMFFISCCCCCCLMGDGVGEGGSLRPTFIFHFEGKSNNLTVGLFCSTGVTHL